MSAAAGVVWHEGRVTAAAEAQVAATDRGLLYGDGVFETLRAYGGEPFRLQAHVERLFAGAAALSIPPPCGPEELADAVRETLRAGGLREAYVRITLTRGVGGAPGELTAYGPPTLLIHARPYAGYAPELYERGMRAMFTRARRNETSPLARIKSLNYLDNCLARAQAAEEGFDEALVLNTRGRIVEATAANLFLVRAGRVVTPPVADGILPGITRAVVMELVPVAQESLGVVEFWSAQEAFLTNSLMEIMPLVAIRARPIGDGRPGPVTREVHERYRTLVREERQTFP